MTNATQPYFLSGKWWLDVDPDDWNYVVADVTQDLADRSTTAVQVEGIPTGVTVLEAPAVQGGLMVAKVTMASPQVTGVIPHITFRITCANTERFDRTIWFSLEDH